MFFMQWGWREVIQSDYTLTLSSLSSLKHILMEGEKSQSGRLYLMFVVFLPDTGIPLYISWTTNVNATQNAVHYPSSSK